MGHTLIGIFTSVLFSYLSVGCPSVIKGISTSRVAIIVMVSHHSRLQHFFGIRTYTVPRFRLSVVTVHGTGGRGGGGSDGPFGPHCVRDPHLGGPVVSRPIFDRLTCVPRHSVSYVPRHRVSELFLNHVHSC